MCQEILEISVGTDEVEIDQISTVVWEMDGTSYQLMLFNTDMTSDALFEMAAELLK